jgi:hypothetical protein
MNFKPTLWKSIVSIGTGFLVNLIIFIIFILNGYGFVACIDGGSCPQPSLLSLWFELMFHPVPIVIFIVAVAVIYVVWSIIQKK